MKVRELMQQLSKLNPELELYCMTEDESLLRGTNRGFMVFVISSIGEVRAEPTRLDDRTPYMDFSSDHAIPLAVADITSSF
jgi:hypothetical protein